MQNTSTQISLTDFMNEILKLRTETGQRLAGEDAQSIREHLAFLDQASIKGEKDQDFRLSFYTWMLDGGNIYLRILAVFIGFDYWGLIGHQNIIDFYDSLRG